jgi:hypothetical protein
MVTRLEILTALPKLRLRELAATYGVLVHAQCNKDAIILALSLSRRFTTLDLLERLSLKELKAICLNAKRDSREKSKAELIHRLTGDTAYLLKTRIVASLKKQGFRCKEGGLVPPSFNDKSAIRELHRLAVDHKRQRAKPHLARHELNLLSRVADGDEVHVASIAPRIVEVMRGTQDELLFRYICLHWSIPVSSGYGRRLRLLVVDDANNKLIGIIGLGDPVFALSPRDSWIGFTDSNRKQYLHNVVDAFVLGAIPPYSQLLAGKLVAMLAASNEVRQLFRNKYGNRNTIISNRKQDGELALLTTTSALGRSSIYNRLRFENRPLYIPVGYTRGYGDFQFLNGLYTDLFQFAKSRCEPSAKQGNWGSGFRNRREVVKKCLSTAGLSEQLLQHGVKRQVFVVPLANNSAAFLRGDDKDLFPFDYPIDRLFHHFKTKWLLPRAARNADFQQVRKDDYRLWSE